MTSRLCFLSISCPIKLLFFCLSLNQWDVVDDAQRNDRFTNCINHPTQQQSRAFSRQRQGFASRLIDNDKYAITCQFRFFLSTQLVTLSLSLFFFDVIAEHTTALQISISEISIGSAFLVSDRIQRTSSYDKQLKRNRPFDHWWIMILFSHGQRGPIDFFLLFPSLLHLIVPSY